MSGPIVRKYGFPNFDKIFGERDLQHGVDDSGEPANEGDAPDSVPAKSAPKAKPTKSAPKSKKKP